MGRKKKQKRAKRAKTMEPGSRASTPQAPSEERSKPSAEAGAREDSPWAFHEDELAGKDSHTAAPEEGTELEEDAVTSGSAFAAALADELDDEALFLAAMADVEGLSDRELRVAKGLAPVPSQEPEASEEGRSTSRSWRNVGRRGGRSGSEELGPLGVMNFVRKSVPRKVVKQLRRGGLRIADDLDLHGMTWKEAKREVTQFLRQNAADDGYTCVLIIHGKGHGAVLGKATLKSRLYTYLQQQPHVAAAISASPKDGGLGAAYVLVT